MGKQHPGDAHELLHMGILEFEEGHPAARELDAPAWIARIAEQVGLTAMAVSEHDPDSVDSTLRLIGKFSAIGAEAIRAAARFHPSTKAGTPMLRMIDETLDAVQEAVQKEREPAEALSAVAVMLGTAAAGALDLDTEARGESIDPDRVAAIRGEDSSDTFLTGLFGMAQVSAELIESQLADIDE